MSESRKLEILEADLQKALLNIVKKERQNSVPMLTHLGALLTVVAMSWASIRYYVDSQIAMYSIQNAKVIEAMESIKDELKMAQKERENLKISLSLLQKDMEYARTSRPSR